MELGLTVLYTYLVSPLADLNLFRGRPVSDSVLQVLLELQQVGPARQHQQGVPDSALQVLLELQQVGPARHQHQGNTLTLITSCLIEYYHVLPKNDSPNNLLLCKIGRRKKQKSRHCGLNMFSLLGPNKEFLKILSCNFLGAQLLYTSFCLSVCPSVCCLQFVFFHHISYITRQGKFLEVSTQNIMYGHMKWVGALPYPYFPSPRLAS